MQLNPFRKRQSGKQTSVQTPTQNEEQEVVIHPPFPRYNWEACITALQRTPTISNDDFALVMGMNMSGGQDDSAIVARYRESAMREARRRQLIAEPKEPTTGPLPASPHKTPDAHASPSLQAVQQEEKITLVNYSPEELVQHVDHSLNRVQFGWSTNITFMENYSELWSLTGPLVLLIGTIGEVFLVLWLRQKVQGLIEGLSIVAVALVLEGTFLAVSYKAATMRNRAERRPEGATDLDKQKLRRQFLFWFALALGVCATQIVFIVAQTSSDGIGVWGVWIFAVLRAAFTLVADGYTAFAHEEKPTTGEQALEEQEQRAKAAQKFLEQKKKEVTILNDGILDLREARTKAEIKEDKLRTQLEVEKLQNQTQIETLREQQQQATMFTRLGNNMMRALFDPELPDEDREKLLGVMQGFMSANKALSTGYRVVDEEKRQESEDDL